METADLVQRVDAFWDDQVLPTLMDFMRIPNQSPAFDKDWRDHGHMEQAVSLVADWVRAQGLADCTVEVLREGQRTPLLWVEVPGQRPGSVVVYGHLDKQPPMTGWREGLGPWSPVLDRQGRLYGRGGADDGYAVFAAVSAVKALQAGGVAHPRVGMLIECSEESGSPDLPAYLTSHAARIGSPDLVLCLDSGCGDYKRLWDTTSLRGLLQGSLTVSVLRDGVHSGMGGGIVPSPLRILRLLLDRLEDPETGEMRPEALHVEIPELRIAQARESAAALGERVADDFGFLPGVRSERDSVADMLIASSWKTVLAITGQEGIPAAEEAGNVLLPSVKVKLSMRLPPTLDPGKAAAAVRETLEADPPYGAQVKASVGGMAGWEAPPLAPWLAQAFARSSEEIFGQPAHHLGGGGTIPFMRMIGERFPNAQFLTTGVLGPDANAHGPNEVLHVPYAKRFSAAMARVIEAVPTGG